MRKLSILQARIVYGVNRVMWLLQIPLINFITHKEFRKDKCCCRGLRRSDA